KGVQGFVARHDGYAARFGLLHEREVKLAENGNVLTGRDRFLRPGGAAIRNNGRDFVTVRFHIHPDIGLLHDEQGRLTLAASQGDTWVFTCAEVAPEIEESIYFAGLGGPRRSRQIVLAFKASEIAEVHWHLTRAAVAGYPENN
ncbi:heparinase II/III family protein, partial [Mesorhizobium sp. M1A.F.Ca.IN.020.03.1.1]